MSTQPGDATRPFNRRQFLGGATLLGGAAVLSACGSPTVDTPAAGASTSRPPVGQEPGKLSILEWGGYEANGTKAQSYGLLAGKDYTDKYGGNSISYTYINNDDQALTKATSVGSFDLMHPCHENLQDYVDRGLVQPWNTDLLPSFGELNPYLVEAGQMNGQQYMIPWDWGYASLLYRKDKIDPADATGWELAWNPKYKGRISLWSGASSNFEVAGLILGFPDIDNPSTDEIEQAKQKLIEQKPLNKFYWDSEYGQMQPAFKSGTIWIAYTWQDALVSMTDAGLPVEYLQPSQGRLSWLCGFMLGANTKNYYHAHEYVESYINKKACTNLTNLFYYGSANIKVNPDDIQNQTLVKSLNLDNPEAIAADNVHLQGYMPNKTAIETAWQEVVAS